MKLIWSCFAFAVRAFAVTKGPAGDIYGETLRERDRDRGLMGRRTPRHWWRLLAPEVALSVWGAVLGCGGGATGPKPLTFARVSAGGSHTCDVTTAGAAYCWGDNDFGQLGNGTKATSLVPARVAQ